MTVRGGTLPAHRCARLENVEMTATGSLVYRGVTAPHATHPQERFVVPERRC